MSLRINETEQPKNVNAAQTGTSVDTSKNIDIPLAGDKKIMTPEELCKQLGISPEQLAELASKIENFDINNATHLKLLASGITNKGADVTAHSSETRVQRDARLEKESQELQKAAFEYFKSCSDGTEKTPNDWKLIDNYLKSRKSDDGGIDKFTETEKLYYDQLRNAEKAFSHSAKRGTHYDKLGGFVNYEDSILRDFDDYTPEGMQKFIEENKAKMMAELEADADLKKICTIKGGPRKGEYDFDTYIAHKSDIESRNKWMKVAAETEGTRLQTDESLGAVSLIADDMSETGLLNLATSATEGLIDGSISKDAFLDVINMDKPWTSESSGKALHRDAIAREIGHEKIKEGKVPQKIVGVLLDDVIVNPSFYDDEARKSSARLIGYADKEDQIDLNTKYTNYALETKNAELLDSITKGIAQYHQDNQLAAHENVIEASKSFPAEQAGQVQQTAASNIATHIEKDGTITRPGYAPAAQGMAFALTYEEAVRTDNKSIAQMVSDSIAYNQVAQKRIAKNPAALEAFTNYQSTKHDRLSQAVADKPLKQSSTGTVGKISEADFKKQSYSQQIDTITQMLESGDKKKAMELAFGAGLGSLVLGRVNAAELLSSADGKFRNDILTYLYTSNKIEDKIAMAEYVLNKGDQDSSFYQSAEKISYDFGLDEKQKVTIP